MNFSAADNFQTNTFGFNLPCKQFVIAAERTRERRLPMVDEFILRILHTVKSISAGRLARFFGFEGRDLGIAISDLESRGLVTVEGENLRLHASAEELFRTSDGSVPTITVAEPMHADVWFDLITKHMVSGRGFRNVQHLVPLPARQTLDEGEARAAFHANFRDYLRIARNDKNADQWNLYSILDVHPGRFSYVQIGGSEVLTLEPSPKLEQRLQLDEVDRTGRSRKLTEAMTSELRTRDDVAPTGSATHEFTRIFGRNVLSAWTLSNGYFDLPNWYSNALVSGADTTVPIVGYPYVERNRKTIATLLASAKLRPANEDRWELTWLRPGGFRWGATEDVPATLESLRSTIRALAKGGVLSSVLVSPAAVRAKDAFVFQRMFDRGLHAPAGKTSPAMEVLAVADSLAVVTVMTALSGSVSVPVGYATIDPELVQRAFEVTRVHHLQSDCIRLWPRVEST